jgi:nucleoside-diphosphate-sugar epimerase
MKRIVVAGAGGFIGGHLVQFLVKEGHQVRAVDIKPLNEWYQVSVKADNLVLDLKFSTWQQTWAVWAS